MSYDYEAGVYNSFVREAVRQNGEEWNNQMGISSDYENVLYFPIRAESEQHARQIAEKEWPEKSGFVIDCIILIGD
tara:strand:+ start:595 stop:822 length:228 start_codon:yes stop_codon:yes gene_type:complete